MKSFVLALVIPLHPLVSENVLEPSVRNEVDHALSRAARLVSANAVAVAYDAPKANAGAKKKCCPAGDIFGTNGLSATDIAIKLVSAQNRDGRWTCGTNDVTTLVIDILKSL